MTRPSLTAFFQGKLSQESLTRRYIPAILGIFALLLLIARLLLPYNPTYPYDWTTSTISRLGWPQENTTGWVFFNLAFLFLGIVTLPLVPFYFRKFSVVDKWWAIVIALSLLVASVGEMLLGAIPNFNTADMIFTNLHKVDALVAFFGCYFAAISASVLLLHFGPRRTDIIISPRMLPRIYTIVLAYGIFAVFMMLFGVPKQDLAYYVYDPATPRILALPLWEWQSFVIALFLGIAPSYFNIKYR
ncbi:MAG TPA: hypothetical protein VKK79_12950 [Candidatus Lokiarchaeia archaeon]|nr:hypothetical protein [Candidatus Lokiarchaeia archaeon]